MREEISEAVEYAIERALAKVPSERFSSMAEFVAALTALPSAPRGGRRRTLTVALVAVLGFLALAYFGWLPGTIRPAAASFFSERDRVVVADFTNDTDHPALGLAVREAITTDLEQSEHANVVDRRDVNAVLERMRRPDSIRVDLDVALEVARREGYPAVITGGVTRLGAGYQLSVQIVEVSSGEVAVRLRETAKSDRDILGAVERLSHLTRRHLGESLASVRRSQPLPVVTTPSLEALQFYARASVYASRGEIDNAIPLATQAIVEDSAFAAAHRGLSLWYRQTGDPASAQRHIDLAYRFNERLLPRERFLVGATYSRVRGQLDSSMFYYSLLLDRNPNDNTALNNLGDLYERMGRYEEALELYRRALEGGGNAVHYLNLASVARTLNMHELADSVFVAMREHYPNIFMTWQTQAMNAYFADDVALLEQIAVDMVNHRPFPFPNIHGYWLHSLLTSRRGQISGTLEHVDSVTALSPGISTQFIYLPLLTAEYAALAGGAPEKVLPYLKGVAPLDELGAAPTFEYRAMGILANGYAMARDKGAAERLLVRMDSLAGAVGIVPPAIGAQVRAVLALNEGAPEESLEWLRRARAAAFGFLHHSGRLLLADTYAALGRYEDAAAHYDSLTSTYRLNYDDVWTYAPILPVAHERAAAAYLALGDTASAVFDAALPLREATLTSAQSVGRNVKSEHLGNPGYGLTDLPISCGAITFHAQRCRSLIALASFTTQRPSLSKRAAPPASWDH